MARCFSGKFISSICMVRGFKNVWIADFAGARVRDHFWLRMSGPWDGDFFGSAAGFLHGAPWRVVSTGIANFGASHVFDLCFRRLHKTFNNILEACPHNTEVERLKPEVEVTRCVHF
jgi:hypothetical protein